MEEHKACELEGDLKHVTLLLVNLSGPNTLRRLGLEIKIQNGRSLRLLRDTGASGIVITQRCGG